MPYNEFILFLKLLGFSEIESKYTTCYHYDKYPTIYVHVLCKVAPSYATRVILSQTNEIITSIVNYTLDQAKISVLRHIQIIEDANAKQD